MSALDTFTIDTRDIFTAHKTGCAHLNKSPGHFHGHFILTAPPTREGLRLELDAEGFEDSDLAFAPCLRGLK